jgi:hypothetical protein
MLGCCLSSDAASDLKIRFIAATSAAKANPKDTRREMDGERSRPEIDQTLSEFWNEIPPLSSATSRTSPVLSQSGKQPGQIDTQRAEI